MKKRRSDFAYNSVAYSPVKTGLSESEAEEEQLNQSQNVGTSILIGLFFRVCFRLRQCGFHWTLSGGVISGVGRKKEAFSFS